MGHRQELQDFIGDRYPDSKKLRAFVDDTFGKRAVNAIGWGSGLADEASDLITWIKSKGAIAKLWSALRTENPDYAADIDKHEAAWPAPEPDDPASPKRTAFLQRKAVRIAIIAVLASGAIAGGVAIYVATRPEPRSLIVVIHKSEQWVAEADDNPFEIVIDGKRRRVPPEGLSIGLGALIPDDVVDDYRRHRPTGMPIKVDTRLTAKLVSDLKVSYQSTPCPRPDIDVEKDFVWLVQLDLCK